MNSLFAKRKGMVIMDSAKQLNNMTRTGVINIGSEKLVTNSQNWLQVSDVMSKYVHTISSGETLVSAANKMYEESISCLVVVEGEKVEGILTEKDLLKSIALKEKDFAETIIKEKMSSPVVSIPPCISILDASEVMRTKSIKQLPILDGDQLAGIVTQTDLTRALTSYGMWKDVSEIMTPNPTVIHVTDNAENAAKEMNSNNLSCIVAIDNDLIKGIVTQRDLLKVISNFKQQPADITVEQIMTSPVITVNPSHSVCSSFKTMEQKRIRRIVVAENGIPCGIVTQTDVFKAIKDKLQKQEEKNIQLLESSENNIFTLDLDGVITYVNPALLDLLELPDSEELIGQTFLPEQFWADPEDRKCYLDKLKALGNHSGELTLQKNSGNKIYVNVFFTSTKDTHGQINGFQGIIYDLTDRKNAEDSARAAYAELQKAHEDLKKVRSSAIQSEKMASLGALAAGVAHEMNTPLGFVASNFQTLEAFVNKLRALVEKQEDLIGQVETLNISQIDSQLENIRQFREDMNIDFILSDIQELFGDSKEGLTRVTNIVKNLKDFSRVDQADSFNKYDINKGIKATLVVAGNEIKYDAIVETELSDIPEILCNSGQLNQVFLNIIVNAAHAIRDQQKDDKGTIVIKTYSEDDMVFCEISDDGHGIPESKLSKIFDPFFTTKPPGKGTGLGLSVSYDIIVNKHKGELIVDSIVGKGTTFKIKLPVAINNSDRKEMITDGKEQVTV